LRPVPSGPDCGKSVKMYWLKLKSVAAIPFSVFVFAISCHLLHLWLITTASVPLVAIIMPPARHNRASNRARTLAPPMDLPGQFTSLLYLLDLCTEHTTASTSRATGPEILQANQHLPCRASLTLSESVRPFSHILLESHLDSSK
jgi:hypothetical protein